jgi:hypothetical protein
MNDTTIHIRLREQVTLRGTSSPFGELAHLALQEIDRQHAEIVALRGELEYANIKLRDLTGGIEMTDIVEKLRSPFPSISGAVRDGIEAAAEIERLRTLTEQAREALEPFADIGAWLFATNLPNDTPLVDVRGLNGTATSLTRGHFKAAHAAAWEIRDPEEAPQPSPSPEKCMCGEPRRGRACQCEFAELPDRITDLQRKALDGLLSLARATFYALDDSEELACGKVQIESRHFATMSVAFNELDELPDDQPGYVMNEVGKAAWALRDLTHNA